MPEDAPYDPYIPSGQAGGSQGNQNFSDPRFAEINQNLEAAKSAMHQNVQGLSTRGANLNDVHAKTDRLAESAQGFRRGANKVRKQMWLKDMKMRICLIAGIIILILIIVLPIVFTVGKSG